MNDRRVIGAAAWLVPTRSEQIELLDQGVGTLDDVRENLGEMWRANRTFGGVRALTRHLYPLLERHSSPVRVVDLGSGSGKLALVLTAWAQRQGIALTVFSVDVAARHLTVARENIGDRADIALLQADALALPFAPDQIDYFVSSLFLHHFDPDTLIVLLRDLYQRGRRGIVMSDLTRGVLPLLGFRAIQPVFARHTLTRHDGLLSIRRAYTPAELLRLARAAGIETARVLRDFPWRMTLVAEKPYV
ncbi:MAG: methyltransferase domain-containing protein [Chloroflexota bacterium]|nr:methyltransferase domain-containing protein [Chloroflexota bacterium]